MSDKEMSTQRSPGLRPARPYIVPDFDKLSELAKTEPGAFEAMRIELCQQFIDSAPVDLQRRLEGLQFRIDMERRRSGNPVKNCMTLSAMMNDSLSQLSLALSNPEEFLRENRQNNAEILPFEPRS